MTVNSSASALVAAEAAKYRASMAGFLHQALVAINEFLSTVNFDEIFRPIDQTRSNNDPVIVFRQTSYLLTAKARLHIIAALQANQTHNIHSLAVQMRPTLECAGQVVLQLKDLLFQQPGAEKRIARYLGNDYYQTMIRQSRGQIDHNEFLKTIDAAYSAACTERKEPLRKLKFRESEKVRDLEFGKNWYSHLSNCFYHSDLPALKGYSYYGGVGSCNTVHDQYAFATLLDYLTHQVMVMLLYDAVLATVNSDGIFQKGDSVEKVEKLLQAKKAVGEHFKTTLMSVVDQ